MGQTISSSLHVIPETMLPDLFRSYPWTRALFDRYGLTGCGGREGPAESIRFFSRAHGVDEKQLMEELRQLLEDPSRAQSYQGFAAANVADTIYRRFFLGAIFTILSVGAVWGAYLLWRIAFAHNFTAVSIFDVNAHGHAQIFGWVGLFIMGFGYQSFPRMWHTRLVWPRLAVHVFSLVFCGMLLHTLGLTLREGSAALALVICGGLMETIGVTIFAAQILKTYLKSGMRFEPYLAFVMAALGWFELQAVFGAWHSIATMQAAGRDALLWQIATYQAPLRDMQIHGLALFMILGVSIRMLPAFYSVPKLSPRRCWTALALLSVGVAAEIVFLILFRFSGKLAFAAMLLPSWLSLAAGCALIVLPWKPWKEFPESDRSSKFVRAAFGWLALSLLMLLLLPLHQLLSGLMFSHAYYGAIRHAITVGFISLMMVGLAAKFIPTLNGVDMRALSPLWAPFVLINLGCFLRVVLQSLTDWRPEFYSFVGISGVLEVTGLAWWAAGLVRIVQQGKKAELDCGAADLQKDDLAVIRPAVIGGQHKVGDVLRWYPETEKVFLAFGFTPLTNPILRRTVATKTAIRQAASICGIDLNELLSALNSGREGQKIS